MTNTAIIPARGGSKRIPGKNVREFCGKPMIAWSIEAALECQLFDQVIVSTDCSEIARISHRYGAVTPFTRPPELSDDHTPTIPVIRHAIGWLQDNGFQPANICCLYATAPFVQPMDLGKGLERLESDPDLEFAFSVTEFSFPILRGLRIDGNRVRMFWPEHELTRSQDLTPAFHDAGQFYWGRVHSFLNHDGFFSARSAPVILPQHRAQDIDTPEDWQRAEYMFRAWQAQPQRLAE